MLKVLMIGNHPSNKGGMTSVINQIRNHNWRAENIELAFIPTFMPGNPIKKTVFFAVSYIKILLQLVVSKPDIVHMHMSYKGSFTRKYAVHKLCRLFKVKDIIHLHGSEFKKWYNGVDDKKKKQIRALLSETDRFIVLGEEWKKIIQEIEPSTNITIISNGIEIPKEIVRWNEEFCKVLFLGVLIPRKGVADLINAIAIIRNRGIGNLKFVIAGTGEEEEKLKRQVADSGLEEIVSFAGWVSGENKEKLILESQVLVSPSYNEGLPISLLEAASHGMPIVATDVGDISMLVHDGENGCLLCPGDVEALANAMIKVGNKETFEKMSEKSRKIAEESFSIQSFYKKLAETYRYVGETNGK